MRIRLQGSSHAVRLLSELNRCRLSRLLCDVVLQVGGRSFPAHRAVLACSCTHFHSLFSQGPRSSLSLDFVSATNFEKVLTFIYTGEVFTDLIDVRVLYELAERLGVRELVQACHTTFPDLQSSSMGQCSNDLDPEAASASAMAASVCSSSAASCSSLSSSAVPTPVTPSPLSQGRACRSGQPHVTSHSLSLSLSPKAEATQPHIEYSHAPDSKPASDAHCSQAGTDCPPVLPLQLKMEVVEEEEVVRGCMEERTEKGRSEMEDTQAVVSGTKTVTSVTLSRVPESCSFPDSSAQLGSETCAPSSSCGEPLDGLQMGPVEGDGRVSTIFEEEEAEESRRALQAGEQPEGAEQWRGLAEEIIELSDEEERYLEEEEDDEEEDEDDLVFVENGSGNDSSGAVDPAREAGMVAAAACKACGQALPADATAIRAHAETHLTEAGECRVCGTAFPEHSASVTHALSHVGILLFSCDMCQQQFCSQSKMVRHRRQAAARYSLPTPDQLNSVAQSQGGEVQCAVCTKSIAKDFKVSGLRSRQHLKKKMMTLTGNGNSSHTKSTPVIRLIVVGDVQTPKVLFVCAL